VSEWSERGGGEERERHSERARDGVTRAIREIEAEWYGNATEREG